MPSASNPVAPTLSPPVDDIRAYSVLAPPAGRALNTNAPAKLPSVAFSFMPFIPAQPAKPPAPLYLHENDIPPPTPRANAVGSLRSQLVRLVPSTTGVPTI